MGPIGAARVGFINDEYVLNPQLDEMTESQLDLVVAGTQDAVLMVESEAKELTEELMLGAVMFGHRHFQPVIDAIIRLAEKAAKEPRELQVPDTGKLEKEMLALVEQDVRAAYAVADKQQRHAALDAAKAKVLDISARGAEGHPIPSGGLPRCFKTIGRALCAGIFDNSRRIDGAT
jgi:polyribonucleotide nucleotidyltransferase